MPSSAPDLVVGGGTVLPPASEPAKGRERWRETIEENVGRWWSVLDAQARVTADPVNPMLVVHEFSSRLPANAVVTADSGSATNWTVPCR